MWAAARRGLSCYSLGGCPSPITETVPTATYILSTIHHAVEIATTLPRSWFRGHDTPVGELTPRVFRPQFHDEAHQLFRPTLELEMIEAFKADAPALAVGRIPDEGDRLGWLYLMQHYQAPTRLLDWTQSCLVALYFAVSKSSDKDGEVWAMYPQALNAVGEVGPNLPLLESNPVLRYLVDEPYWAGTPESLAKKCGMEAPIRCPAAFPPRRAFTRMIAQESVFTIHPVPLIGCAIPDLLTHETQLVRYMVPHGAKRRLVTDLRSLGINDRTIFPDFEGLSKHVIADSSTIAYSPPDPPKCGGPTQPRPTSPE